jgi:hypothetical protein
VTRPIRQTNFTWDVDHESRSAVWDRIKAHVQQELDRIHAEHVRDRRIARRRARPQYTRNQQLIKAAQRGVPIGELARQFGISRQRVREIMRTDARWLARNGPDRLSGEYRHPAQCGTPCDRDAATAMPRTLMVLLDP